MSGDILNQVGITEWDGGSMKVQAVEAIEDGDIY